MVAIQHGMDLGALQVGAGTWLGHGDGAYPYAAGHPGQIVRQTARSKSAIPLSTVLYCMAYRRIDAHTC